MRTAVALAAVPLLVLAGLALSGDLAWRPALAGACVMLAGAAACAFVWRRDLHRIVAALNRAADSGLSGPPMPVLAATAEVAAEAGRLSRALAARESVLQAVVRAEQGLVHRLPDPLLVLGVSRSVLRTNAAADRAFGPGLSALLRHPGLRAALDRAQGEGRVQQADIGLPGHEVAATIIPLDPPLADGGSLLAVLSDRTRERAVERMRADFVANASHELRTPLASLIGFIDTLRGPAANDPPAQARFLGIMAEQAHRMNRLIDDLLSLSRIELTEHQAPAEAVDLPALLCRVAAAIEPLAAKRRVRLEVEAGADLAPIPGDADQLEQVMHNLLDNAIKYGRDAGTVRASVRPAPPGPPWPARPGVALLVSDDGPGIGRDHIPRLTERFYRADKHRSRAVGGTGLGLAIVKHIVNRHRGQMSIESVQGPDQGSGTTVTVWLPQAAAPGSAAGARA